MTQDAVDDWLVHFGVMGMKWGVRKDRDISTESRAQRALSRKTAEEHMWNVVKDEPLWKAMSEDDYRSLSTKGETFAKGEMLRRVSMDSSSILKGETYVSQKLEDFEFYKAIIPAYGPSHARQGAGKKEYKKAHYEVALKATKRLASPSEKERVDAFIELLSEPSIQVKGKTAPITGREYLYKSGSYPKMFYKRYDDKKLALEAWDRFVQSQGNQNNPLAKAYYDKIRSRGYNTLIDDNDRGKYTKTPLILLDPESTVKVSSVRRLTTDEINQAQRNLKGGE